jgi:hypothetical protein
VCRDLVVVRIETDDVVPSRTAVSVDAPPAGNGEDPPSEISAVTRETIQGPTDIDPHLTGYVLGRIGSLGEEQSHDLRLIDPPHHRDCISIARAGTFDRFDVSDVPAVVRGSDDPLSAIPRSVLSEI